MVISYIPAFAWRECGITLISVQVDIWTKKLQNMKQGHLPL